MDELKVILKLAGTDITKDVRPVFGDNVKLNIAREQDQMFFREKLAGDFHFVRDDFDFISACGANVQFELSFYRGSFFVGKGYFYKTDCEMDYDNRICKVVLTTADRYETIMNNMNNKYNLVKLAPRVAQLNMHRRAVMQLYVKGEKVVTNVVGGIHFEQSCAEVNDAGALRENYHFSYALILSYITMVSVPDPTYVDALGVYTMIESSGGASGGVLYDNGRGYRIQYAYMNGTTYLYLLDIRGGATPGDIIASCIIDGSLSDGKTNIIFKGTGAQQSTTIGTGSFYKDGDLYARVLSPINITSTTCFPRPIEDITEYDSNYPYVAPLSGDIISPRIATIGEKSTTPTPWGVDSSSRYFKAPTLTDTQKSEGIAIIPVGQSHWNFMSTWILADDYLKEYFDRFNSRFVLKDAYPLTSAIEVLLKEVDPSLHFGEGETFSQFLSAWNEETTSIDIYPFPHSRKSSLFITPITNVKKTLYEQAAQRGDISLKEVFDMLRDVFQCYWWIDSSNNLHIEHIVFFKGSNSYLVPPQIDLTQEYALRPNKTWEYNTNIVTGKKSRCPSRYEFNWGDAVTEQFNGVAIDVLDKYIDAAKKNVITINNFISDIDYTIINPSGVGDDLYALIEADENLFVNIPSIRLDNMSPKYKMQNGYVSFLFAEVNYYPYDMGGWKAKAGDANLYVEGTKTFKSQKLTFPITIPQLRNIGRIGSSVGVGEVETLEVNANTLAANAEVYYGEKQDFTDKVEVYYTRSGQNRIGWIRNNIEKSLKVTYALYNPSTNKIISRYEKTLFPHEEYSCFSVVLTNQQMIMVLNAEDVTFVHIGKPRTSEYGVMEVNVVSSLAIGNFLIEFDGKEGEAEDWGMCFITAREGMRIDAVTHSEANYDFAWANHIPCFTWDEVQSAQYKASGYGGNFSFTLNEGDSIILGYTKDQSAHDNGDRVDFFISKL